MPRKAANGPLPDQVSFSGSDVKAIGELGDRLRDAANPADDFDIDLELKVIIEKNAQVARLAGELADAKEAAKLAREAWEVASTELSERIVELGREYPLFEGRGA